jgi:hypothetical protein
MYFDYFNIIDLMGSMPDGTRQLKLRRYYARIVTVAFNTNTNQRKYITYSGIYKRAVQEHQLAETHLMLIECE